LVVGEWVYGIKFDFRSAGSTVVRDRPGLSYTLDTVARSILTLGSKSRFFFVLRFMCIHQSHLSLVLYGASASIEVQLVILRFSTTQCPPCSRSAEWRCMHYRQQVTAGLRWIPMDPMV